MDIFFCCEYWSFMVSNLHIYTREYKCGNLNFILLLILHIIPNGTIFWSFHFLMNIVDPPIYITYILMRPWEANICVKSRSCTYILVDVFMETDIFFCYGLYPVFLIFLNNLRSRFVNVISFITYIMIITTIIVLKSWHFLLLDVLLVMIIIYPPMNVGEYSNTHRLNYL